MNRRFFRWMTAAVLIISYSIPARAAKLLVPVGEVVGLSLSEGTVTVAAFLADGISGRSLKILVMMVVFLAWAAVLSHVSGRAVLMREGRSA